MIPREEIPKKHHHKVKKKLFFFIGLALVLLFLSLFSRIFQQLVLKADFSHSMLILIYLPGFFILTGLIETWIPSKFIAHHVGKHSGIKGSIVSFLAGSIMLGPLYLAFPIALVLLKKGISKFNILLFIGAWSTFPIGQEIFEIQFMGLRFFLLRVAFSVIFVILTAIIMKHMNVFKEVSKT